MVVFSWLLMARDAVTILFYHSALFELEEALNVDACKRVHDELADFRNYYQSAGSEKEAAYRLMKAAENINADARKRSAREHGDR